MSPEYPNKKTRSRRTATEETGIDVLSLNTDENSILMQLPLPFAQATLDFAGAIEEISMLAGVEIMKALIADEVESVAGPKHCPDPDREASRWGTEESYVVFGGKKIPIRRQRLRGEGGEVDLHRLKAFQSRGRLQQKVADRILIGVSTRDYETSLDAVCEGYGVRKSSVSREWKAASMKQLQELMERPLGDMNLVAIMIDGIDFKGHLLLVALGFTADGRKHVLGLWEGQTENSVICGELLDDLIDRGLDPALRYLFVLDGSKALRKAVMSRFGDRAEIQRCQLHKERNVLAHLPPKYHAAYRFQLHAAWSMNKLDDARKELKRISRNLAEINASASRSLEEALEETLTIHRLKIPDLLRRTFRSTNPIESCFSRTRDLCRNVKRWRNGNMTQRWAGTVLLEAEKRFRRVKGYRQMPELIKALGRSVDSVSKAG